jgi:hypothetical protein
MTGAHIAVAEIAKITAMTSHDHASSFSDVAAVFGAGGLFVLAFTRRALCMVHLLVRTGWVAGALRRSKPDKKSDGRDQDCAREK